jgi:tetratricopeptide (TPR) repeat protein
LFFSKLGKFTVQEYQLARDKKLKVFLYFKKGFTTDDIEEYETYKRGLEFKKKIEKENKALYKSYKTIAEFKYEIQQDLNLYLKKTFLPPPPVAETGDQFPKFLTPAPTKNIELVGRDEELKEMADTLARTDRVLLVNGLGGVGKTELCKRYFWKHADNYNHLAWVDVVGNIRESVVNAVDFEGAGFADTDTVDERFDKIMRFLNHLDKNTLLVADNIENPDDPDLDRLRALPFKVIANSRLNLDGFETHTLDFLNTKKCRDLFYRHYKGKQDHTHVDKITALCGRHTLSVELLARTAHNAAMPVKDLFETLQKKGFNINDIIGDKVSTFWHNTKDKEPFFDHLLKIFDLSNVTEDELHVLTQLSVLPPVHIPIADCCEWMKLENKEAVNSLVIKDWLRRGQDDFNVFMHQVIQEVVRHKTSPDAKKCKKIIVSIGNKLYLEPSESPIDKKEYIIFAESVLRHIEENDEDLAALSNNLAEIYRHMGNFEKALEFQLKALRISEGVLDKNHPHLAVSYNNMSLIYQDLGQPGKALEFQLKALKISEEVLDKNHPHLARSYNNLSLIYKALGDLEKALEFQLKALKIREEVDKNHPDLAAFYNNLAVIYKDLKDYKSALLYGEKAVAIMRHLFPNGHPRLDKAERNLEAIKKERKKKG